MNERLKSLRTLYHAIIIASSAVLLFAAIPDLSTKYRSALQEVSSLRKVQLSDYPSYVKGLLAKQNEANYQFFLHVVHRANLPIKGHPRFTYAFLCDPPPQGDLRLADYDAFLERTHKAAAILVDRDAGVIARKLKLATANISPPPSLVGIDFASPTGYLTVWPDNTRIWEWGTLGNHATNLADVTFYFTNISGSAPNVSPIPVTFTIGPVQSGQLALDWLRSEPFGQKLFGRGPETFLPYLKLFWGRVSMMNLDSATVFLEQQIESTKRGSLSFFGIPVERGLVIWVGPALCLSILVFFDLHLRHFLAIGKFDGAARFPWLISFPGHVSSLLSYGTLFAFPFFANICLLYRHGNWQQPSTRFAICLLLGLVIQCAYGASDVRRFRLTIRKSSAATSAEG